MRRIERERFKGTLILALIMVSLIVLVILFSLRQVSAAPDNLLWSKTWGGSYNDAAYGVAVGNDGIYVAGSTWSNGAHNGDSFVLKYDGSGNLLWENTWGGSDSDYAYGVAVGSDGIYVAGYTTSSGVENEALLLKYDSNGTLLWSRTWGGSSNDYAYGVAVGGDGIYVAGYMVSYVTRFDGHTSYITSVYDAFVLKYDSSGNLLWENTWDGSDSDYAYGVAVGSDGIYVAGSTWSNGAPGVDALLLKYDSNGTLLWSRTWGGSSYGWATGVAVGSDGIYVAGYTPSHSGGNEDVLLLKYDGRGSLQWKNTWGGSFYDGATGVAVGSDGIYVAGATNSYGAGGDAFLLKYDGRGSLQWENTWGGSDFDWAWGVAVGSDGIYVAGATNSYGEGGSDALLLKYAASTPPAPIRWPLIAGIVGAIVVIGIAATVYIRRR